MMYCFGLLLHRRGMLPISWKKSKDLLAGLKEKFEKVGQKFKKNKKFWKCTKEHPSRYFGCYESEEKLEESLIRIQCTTNVSSPKNEVHQVTEDVWRERMYDRFLAC